EHTFLRFCLSCCATIGCWALWIVLAAALVLQAYVVFVEELAVPDFVLRRIEQRLAQANLSVAFGRAQFDPAGRVYMENVRLGPPGFTDPILTARGLFARKSIWAILSGRTVPDEVRVD